MKKGNKDINLKIIQKLTDKEISTVCQANKYISKLCEDESFWLNRLLTKKTKEEISKLKGDLKYKQLYRYLYMGGYKEGIDEAIKNDNIYLYKNLSMYKYKNIFKVSMDAADIGSLEILTYLFIKADENLSQDLKDHIYSTAGEKTLKWMDKMDLIYWSDYIRYWIQFSTSDDDSYHYETIKKYLSKAGDHDDFMYFLGESLEDNSLESREKIFDLFLQNNINDY